MHEKSAKLRQTVLQSFAVCPLQKNSTKMRNVDNDIRALPSATHIWSWQKICLQVEHASTVEVRAAKTGTSKKPPKKSEALFVGVSRN